MASRVRRVAVVAGLVAFGVTAGVDARAEETGGDPPTSATPSGRPSTSGSARAVRRVSAKKVAKPRAKANPGLVATLPGFEMLADGSSRLFVELTHTANVTERRDAHALSYVIHGAHVVHRNNQNALVTVHFNTPVTRARLLPVHGDVVFAVELRAASAPVWRMVDGPDGTGVLQIDFPKGSFLPVGEGLGRDHPGGRPRRAFGPAPASDPCSCAGRPRSCSCSCSCAGPCPDTGSGGRTRSRTCSRARSCHCTGSSAGSRDCARPRPHAGPRGSRRLLISLRCAVRATRLSRLRRPLGVRRSSRVRGRGGGCACRRVAGARHGGRRHRRRQDAGGRP